MKSPLLLSALVSASLFSLAACSDSSGESSSSSTTPAADAATSTNTATPPRIVGRWQSACTPSSDTQTFVLDFDVREGTWAVDYTVFADKTCATKFLTVRIEGPYAVGAASKAVAGAYDARFGFTKKTITPHSAAAAGFLASASGCGIAGFAEGQAKDVSESGCANLGQRPIAACPADYDLVKLEGDRITFGARPADNDMCSEGKRPTALSPLSSTKKAS